MRWRRRLGRAEVSLLQVLFATSLDQENMGSFENLYVFEEVLIMDLEVSVFEFPCLKVRSEMRRPDPFPIRTHTSLLIVPYFMKIVSKKTVSSDPRGM